ncbi:MAG TPA: hypothetical protein VE439_03570 [Anaerolineae bacterium]|jgi:phage shock protein PspC (stress-responsive transcriptional regulator)|nr:hypothetical protein [Anaerolineae bacterium]
MVGNVTSAKLLNLPPVAVVLIFVVLPVVIAIVTYVIVSKEVDRHRDDDWLR